MINNWKKTLPIIISVLFLIIITQSLIFVQLSAIRRGESFNEVEKIYKYQASSLNEVLQYLRTEDGKIGWDSANEYFRNLKKTKKSSVNIFINGKPKTWKSIEIGFISLYFGTEGELSDITQEPFHFRDKYVEDILPKGYLEKVWYIEKNLFSGWHTFTQPFYSAILSILMLISIGIFIWSLTSERSLRHHLRIELFFLMTFLLLVVFMTWHFINGFLGASKEIYYVTAVLPSLVADGMLWMLHFPFLCLHYFLILSFVLLN